MATFTGFWTSDAPNLTRAGIALLLMLAASSSAFAQTRPAGAIAGRITDRTSAPLPGVTISLRGADIARQVITDADGRFALSPLQPGTYSVDAALQGFVSVSRTVTLTSDIRRAHLVWPLELGCLAEVQRVAAGPRDAASSAESILHVRVTSDNGRMAWHAPPRCAPQPLRAHSVEILNDAGRRGAPIAEVFTQAFDVDLSVGAEYLVMLGPDALVGDGLIFPIVSGRVAGNAHDPLLGMTVADALHQLAQWSQGVLNPVLIASGGVWSEHSIDGPARKVRIYLAHDEKPKPVVFLLQGSGCMPSFTVNADGTYHPTSLFQDVVAAESERVHFAVVEKPGVVPLKFDAAMSQDEKERAFELAGSRCSEEFFDNATKHVRVDDVRTAMRALTGQSWVSGFILAGHSEGTHVTTGVLASEPAEHVLAAGLFTSAGPTPFWGGYVSDGGTRAAFEEAFNRVRTLHAAEPDSMYQGLPARRWKTFWLESTPLDDVRESMVPLFVAHGMRDGTILAPDLFVIEAVRQQPARPLRYVVIEDGDHAFATADGRSHIPGLFNDFLGWALNPNRATGVVFLRKGETPLFLPEHRR